MKWKKQPTRRQRRMPYAVVTAPAYDPDVPLPTLKFDPKRLPTFIRPLAFVLLDGVIVAVAPNASVASEWCNVNLLARVLKEKKQQRAAARAASKAQAKKKSPTKSKRSTTKRK